MSDHHLRLRGTLAVLSSAAWWLDDVHSSPSSLPTNCLSVSPPCLPVRFQERDSSCLHSNTCFRLKTSGSQVSPLAPWLSESLQLDPFSWPMKDSEPQHTYRNPNLSQTPLSAPYCILLLLMTGMMETVGFPWTWAQIWVLVLLSETFEVSSLWPALVPSSTEKWT